MSSLAKYSCPVDHYCTSTEKVQWDSRQNVWGQALCTWDEALSGAWGLEIDALTHINASVSVLYSIASCRQWVARLKIYICIKIGQMPLSLWATVIAWKSSWAGREIMHIQCIHCPQASLRHTVNKGVKLLTVGRIEETMFKREELPEAVARVLLAALHVLKKQARHYCQALRRVWVKLCCCLDGLTSVTSVQCSPLIYIHVHTCLVLRFYRKMPDCIRLRLLYWPNYNHFCI